jgi:hypothetical protein
MVSLELSAIYGNLGNFLTPMLTRHHASNHWPLGEITSKGEGRYGNIMCYLLLTPTASFALSVVLGGSSFSLKKKELVGKVWVYGTQIDNSYNKIKQPPNTGLHIAKCDMKLTTNMASVEILVSLTNSF